MIRALWFVIKIAFFVAAAVWLAMRPGSVAIEWMGYTLSVNTGVFLLGISFLILLALVLYRLLSFFVALPARARAFRTRRLSEKGYRALTRGLAAVAAGDTQGANRFAAQALACLPDERRLTLLLEAQAARLSRDAGRTQAALEGLMEDPDTAFLGLRGLMQLAVERGDRPAALQYAEQAQARYPRQPWAIRMVYDLRIRNREWDEAEKMLRMAVRSGALSREKADSDLVAMLLHRAEEDLHQGYGVDALVKLERAHKIDPHFVPAAIALAEQELRRDKKRRAAKIVEAAWKKNPHPALVKIWDAAAPRNKPNDPMARLRWFETLLALRPDSPEGQIAVAQAAMEDGLWGEARAYLLQAERLQPGARLYRLMATLEGKTSRHQGSIGQWMEKASDAPPDRVWTCTQTGRIYDRWSAIAQPHGAFNTIVWDFPQARPPALPDADVRDMGDMFLAPPMAIAGASSSK